MMATIIDGVIIVLLVGSIAYGYSVSRKVRQLMATLKELEPLVNEFSSAVDKTEHSVHLMRENIEVAEQVQEPQVKAVPDTPAEAAFSSRRAISDAPEVPGLRVMRDKKDLVRKFFETSSTARV
ncbi:flagellar motor switch protein [Sulfitobacter mediterraneus]|uniref:flagellar motor switch protein n=1 Tax=Sulfitobacter mediterraneus TaxID=83219 RepID=UPI000EA3A1F0|nr:flagellar motor switch protein [Sulfitobacter mediterraneus]